MEHEMKIEEWTKRMQGTQDAILRVLGELIAQQPEPAVLLRMLAIQPELGASANNLDAARRQGESESIQAVVLYARSAMGRAAALRADERGTPN